MFKQLVLAAFIGIVSTLYIAQQDPWLEQQVLDYFICVFQQSLACNMSATIHSFSFAGTLTLKNMHVSPVQGLDWSWHTNHFEISFSWWQLLLYGSLDFTIVMDDLAMQSAVVDNTLAINDHLNLAFNGPQLGIYTFLQELICSNVACSITDQARNIAFTTAFDGKAKKTNNILTFMIDVFKGSLRVQNRTLCTNMSGSLQLDSYDGQPSLDLCLKGAASFEFPQLGSGMTPCYISGAWHQSGGILSVKNIDNSFAFDPIIVQSKDDSIDISVEAKIPLGYVWRMATDDVTDERVSGSAVIQGKMHVTEQDYHVQGNILLQRILWQTIELGSLGKISFNKRGDSIEGKLYMQRTSGAWLGGNWCWQPITGQTSASIKNNARLTFSPKHDWQILPDDLAVTLQADNDRCDITYDVTATHAKVHNQVASNGHIIVEDGAIKATGLFDDNTYAADMRYQPAWAVNRFSYLRKDGTPLIEIAQEDDAHYTGAISFRCIKDLLKKRYDYDVQGEGSLHLGIALGSPTVVDVHLQDGTIRLARTYNFLSGFDCQLEIDHHTRIGTVHNLLCQLHNGQVTSKKMLVELSEDMTPRFVYAPLIIDHCLINMGKELFAVVSGDMFLSKRSDKGLLLNGQLLIERSQLKANIFSDVLQRKLRTYTAHSFESPSNDMLCDISIKTQYPVRVQTPFLDTDARIDLHIQNNIRDPEVIGTITLNAGKLYFPYKPLYISTGVLHFIPGRLDDPIIELFAKNNIKKNNISLQVTGSIQNQHVRLESSPTLTEEQIVSLLLVGSQEESLNMVMPALIMQNIKSMLFSYDQSATTMSRYFNALLKPFGWIHLVPSFIDQSGRGGLRGAIEIDLNDRWRFAIQKNFSLTEDTRFEIEYLFSDDISGRFTRDIRRDFIAEVEMRYKFGNS